MITLPLVIGHVKAHRKFYTYTIAGLLAIVIVYWAVGNFSDWALDRSISSSDTKAVKLEASADGHFDNANTSGSRADALGTQRKEAQRRSDEQHKAVVAGRLRLAERKRLYDEAQQSAEPIYGSDAELDTAERNLRAKLNQLYPVRTRTVNQ